MYAALIEQLARETTLLSSIAMMQDVRAYKTLKALGQKAVPELLQALRDDNDGIVAIVTLLSDITGYEPDVEPGNMQALIAAWLKWKQ